MGRNPSYAKSYSRRKRREHKVQALLQVFDTESIPDGQKLAFLIGLGVKGGAFAPETGLFNEDTFARLVALLVRVPFSVAEGLRVQQLLLHALSVSQQLWVSKKESKRMFLDLLKLAMKFRALDGRLILGSFLVLGRFFEVACGWTFDFADELGGAELEIVGRQVVDAFVLPFRGSLKQAGKPLSRQTSSIWVCRLILLRQLLYFRLSCMGPLMTPEFLGRLLKMYLTLPEHSGRLPCLINTPFSELLADSRSAEVQALRETCRHFLLRWLKQPHISLPLADHLIRPVLVEVLRASSPGFDGLRDSASLAWVSREFPEISYGGADFRRFEEKLVRCRVDLTGYLRLLLDWGVAVAKQIGIDRDHECIDSAFARLDALNRALDKHRMSQTVLPIKKLKIENAALFNQKLLRKVGKRLIATSHLECATLRQTSNTSAKFEKIPQEPPNLDYRNFFMVESSRISNLTSNSNIFCNRIFATPSRRKKELVFGLRSQGSPFWRFEYFEVPLPSRKAPFTLLLLKETHPNQGTQIALMNTATKKVLTVFKPPQPTLEHAVIAPVRDCHVCSVPGIGICVGFLERSPLMLWLSVFSLFTKKRVPVSVGFNSFDSFCLAGDYLFCFVANRMYHEAVATLFKENQTASLKENRFLELPISSIYDAIHYRSSGLLILMSRAADGLTAIRLEDLSVVWLARGTSNCELAEATLSCRICDDLLVAYSYQKKGSSSCTEYSCYFLKQ